MDALTLWSLIGFLLAAYAVIANDSVQTLGTWMASNNERFNYKTLWVAASGVLLCTLWYGWLVNGGDIHYGRLNKNSIGKKCSGIMLQRLLILVA